MDLLKSLRSLFVFLHYDSTFISSKVHAACSAVFQPKWATCRALYDTDTAVWSYTNLRRLPWLVLPFPYLSCCSFQSHALISCVCVCGLCSDAPPQHADRFKAQLFVSLCSGARNCHTLLKHGE